MSLQIELDRSGLYAATSGSDKVVCLYDFYSGHCLASIFGHSGVVTAATLYVGQEFGKLCWIYCHFVELVTDVKFTQDGTRLISVSGDRLLDILRVT